MIGLPRQHRTLAVLVGAAVAAASLVAGCASSSERSAATTATSASTAASAATATTSGATSTTAPAATPPDLAAVGRLMDAEVTGAGLPGAGLVVVTREGGTVYEHYSGNFTADRVSLIASSSKILTAGVLMRLDDQGVLDVDAPVAEAVEWGAAHPDVTTAQLLSNSSGLKGLDSGPPYMPFICQYVPSGTLGDCARTIFTSTADDADTVAPDTEFRYGGAQWQVAGAVAEAASGRSWAELVRETYVEPCGVRSLAYNNHFAQIVAPEGPFAYPPQFDGDPAVLAPTDNPNMEGGAYATARDYAAVLLMHLRDGRCGDEQVLSAQAVERMRTDRIGEAYGGRASNSLEGYGLGWWVDRDEPYVEDAGAFGAVPWIDLDDGYAAYVVVEATSRKGQALADALRPEIERALAG